MATGCLHNGTAINEYKHALYCIHCMNLISFIQLPYVYVSGMPNMNVIARLWESQGFMFLSDTVARKVW